MVPVTVVSSVINVTFGNKKGPLSPPSFEPRRDFGRVARWVCFAAHTVEIRQKKH
jgi:hypothetical protein